MNNLKGRKFLRISVEIIERAYMMIVFLHHNQKHHLYDPNNERLHD